jgi:hypothetical protein|eukprot:TRINITY_DN54998_c0_g1_i1.p1 TRINITY_DN54998_c0_g1~~TRINITY_DN54998_c0_g1_i1.p1  ORF type:complete len:253 (-),score=33.72 TRINITY_DN54998_c0_g1_i1:86-844(-)
MASISFAARKQDILIWATVSSAFFLSFGSELLDEEECAPNVAPSKQRKGHNTALLQTSRHTQASAPSNRFHRDSNVFQRTTCNWTVFYDQWSPSFVHGEYEHPWEGGVHCLEACCHDPQCNGVQLMSSEKYQCYRYSKLPKLDRKDGRRLGDAKWLVALAPSWSVFLKGAPELVQRNLEMLEHDASAPKVGFVAAFQNASVNSDVISWLSRLGVMAVCAAILVRIISESTYRVVAKLRYESQPNEVTKLVVK